MTSTYVDSVYTPQYDMNAGMGKFLGGMYPQAPQPSMQVGGQLGNSSWMPSVSATTVGNQTTFPLAGTYVPASPRLADYPMGSHVTPTVPSVPSWLDQGIGTGGVDLSSVSSTVDDSFGNDFSFGDATQSPSWFSGLGDWASKNKELITGGVGLATAGLGAFNAWNANQTAKDQLKFQKESFGKQYEAQKGLTNSQLSDRQAQRVREHPDTATSVDDYMKQYGVK